MSGTLETENQEERLNQLYYSFCLYLKYRAAGIHEDSYGKSEIGETPQERSDEEAWHSPVESEVYSCCGPSIKSTMSFKKMKNMYQERTQK